MTDRELLELAAKAAGLKIIRSRLDDPLCRDVLLESCLKWNPLTDDGDALRLAVKLWIDIDFDFGVDDKPELVEAYRKAADGSYFVASEDYQPDPSAATRRAIVRAAAEIGRSM